MFERRVIYADLYRRAMLAGIEANHRVPLIDASVDTSEVPDAMARHEAVYDALEKRARASIVETYRKLNNDEANLDRIDREGDVGRWPIPDVSDPYKR